MKKDKLIARVKQILFLLLISSLLINCQSKVSKRVHFPDSRIQALDSFINNIRTLYTIPGIAFAVVHQDSIYSNAIGIKNSNEDILTSTTPILAGSVSEPMLAYSILQLVQSGKINLDDKVIQHLPYFRTGGNAYLYITIRNLLTHTSGIDNYTLFYDNPSFDANAPETTTRSIESQIPKWEYPEVQILRSPYNYDILADLINKVTEEPFEDYVRETIFKPLKMNSSYFYKIKQAAQPFRIVNYLDCSYKQAKIYPYNRENGGSRGLHASVKDLSGWMFHVLNQNWSKENFFNIQYRSSNALGVGMGWDVYSENDLDIYTKSSEFGGFSSQIILIPSKKIGTLILTNSDFNPSEISRLITGWLNNEAELKLKIPAHLNMGRKLKETGQVRAALKEFRDLKEQAPNDYDFSEKSVLQLGETVLHKEKNPTQAIEFFNFCRIEYPNSSEVYLNLAEAYLLNKDLKNCRITIKKATMFPDKSGNRKDFIKYLNEQIEIIEEKK